MDTIFTTVICQSLAQTAFFAAVYFFICFMLHMLVTTLQYLSAAGALLEWRECNPDLFIGDCPKGQYIVLQKIDACKRLLRFQNVWDFTVELAMLYELLGEHGPHDPEPPRKRFPFERSFGRSFYYKNQAEACFLRVI